MIPVRAYFGLLTRYLRPLRWRVAALGVVLLVGIGLQLVNPQIMKVFLDRVTAGTVTADLVPLAQRAAGRPHRARPRPRHGVPQAPHPG
jgi:hypothetical protein